MGTKGGTASLRSMGMVLFLAIIRVFAPRMAPFVAILYALV